MAAIAEALGGARCSSIYRSSPLYVLDQPDFLNLAVGAETSLEPLALLGLTQSIEARFGRDRSRERRKGPRPLDVDILLYGDLSAELPGLSLPHPGLLERAFALLPLLELEPSLVHPVTARPLAEYRRAVAGQGIYLHAGPPV